MKKIITLTLIAFSAVVVNAQTTKPIIAANAADTKVAAAPVEVLFLKETEFDFGKIPQGKPVTHVFEITNKGKDSLKIVNVQASCGCTTPEWERDRPIAPGATAKITVGYNAAAEGPFTKPVTITYNGSEIKQLFIKGEVWKTPAASAPENKSLGDL
ncbi:MAG: DUF1573 domain-containing protein, partial [Ferruginibacter sp.]